MLKRERRREAGEGMFGILIGLAILFLVVTAGVKIVPLHIHGAEMLDAMNETANFGGLKTPERLKDDLFARAEDVQAPVTLQNITIERNGPYITVQVKYQESVDVFGYKYVYNFDKKVEKLVF